MSNVYLAVLGFLISFITVVLFLILCIRIIISLVKKSAFPKKLLIATLLGVVLTSSTSLYKSLFFTFDHLDREYAQRGPGPLASPAEQYSASAYFEYYGGAAGGVNVWVEVVNNSEKDKPRIVYYSDAKSVFSMEWVDEDTLSIINHNPYNPDSNRSTQLKIGTEIYDERGLACKSLLLKDEYETCYHD